MVWDILKKLLKRLAFKTGKFKALYLRLCKPEASEYVAYLKTHGRLHAIGENCLIWPYTNITDPEYLRIGNNVVLTACTILGHDGSVAMLNKAYDLRLDSVGKVDIRDNVFIGHGAIILPGVTIGPNSIVGAGSVVTKDVETGDIVGGVPARRIGRVDDLVAKLKLQTENVPWGHLIAKRGSAFDPQLEPELIEMRVKYFFGGQH
jgi:acetyltransferase-like isoleucine patch superfamily enzyme